MEKRRVIAIGMEGGLLEPGEERDVLSVSSGTNRGALLFGLPKRSEDDAERALNIACRGIGSPLRQTVKEIEVHFDGTSAVLDWDAMFMPDLPFLPQGKVLVAPSLVKIYNRAFSFDRKEKIGRECFYLEGLRDDPKRIRGLTYQHAPLVGRQAEVGRFKELLEQSGVDQGQVVAIVGEAGIGKTRLAEACKDILREKGVPFAQGTYLLRGSAQPYRAFQEIVSQISGGTITTLSRWEMDDVETDFLRLFLEPTIKISRLANLSEEQIRQGLFLSVRKLIHAAARSPLAVVVEDLHWADRGSIDLLDYVMEGMESTNLLLILVHRPKAKETWTQRLNYNEVQVGAFSEKEVDRFIANASGATRVAANVRNELMRVSLGNPLFVEERVRQLLDTGALELDTSDEEDTILRLSKRTVEDVPLTLHSLIASRFDRLDREARELLRWASLLGSTIDARELSELAKKELNIEPTKHLDSVLSRGYLTEELVYPKRIYRFHHDLIFEVIRNSVEADDRRVRQGKIAHFLIQEHSERLNEETSRIADHFLDSDDPKNATEWAQKAGHNHLELFAYPSAEKYFRAAVEMWRLLPDSSRFKPDFLFEDWAKTLLNIGDHESAFQALHEWKTSGALENKGTEGRFHLLAAKLHRLRSEFDKSLVAVNQAINAFATDSRFEQLKYEAIELRFSALTQLGRARDFIHDAMKTLREVGERYPIVNFRILSRLASQTTYNGEFAQALEFLSKAERLELSTVPPEDLITLQNQYANVLRESGDLERSCRRLTEAVEIARRAGMRDEVYHAMRLRGIDWQEYGHYRYAHRDLEESLRESQRMRIRAGEARSLISIVDWHIDVGADELASTLLEKIEREFTDSLFFWASTLKDTYRAVLSLRAGNSSKAAQLFRSLGKRHREATNDLYASQRFGRAIAIEALHHLRPFDELEDEYRRLRSSTKDYRTNTSKSYFWILDMELATAGLDVGPIDTNAIDLNSIAKCWLRQRAYMVKIQYLAKIGEKKRAKELLKQYRAHREEIIQNVPKEFHDAFRNHKEYSPDLIQL